MEITAGAATKVDDLYLASSHINSSVGSLALNPSMSEYVSVSPRLEYAHVEGSPASVTGGSVYRPTRWKDTCLTDQYIFADYFNGLLRGDLYGADTQPRPVRWRCASNSPFPCGDTLDDIATLGVARQSGHLYVSASSGFFRLADPMRCQLLQCA